MSYSRGDVVLLPFPFVTVSGVEQKARPALVISNHSIRRRFNDRILVGITSQRIDDVVPTEYLLSEGTEEHRQSGLARTSVVRGEYLMTVPEEIIVRKLGALPASCMNEIDSIVRISLGI